MNEAHPLVAELAGIRRYAGRSQDALSARAGVHRKTVSNWERGVSVPRVDDLARVALALGYRLTLSPVEEER